MKTTNYIQKTFKFRKPNRDKLLLFGFKRSKSDYYFSTGLLDGLLKITVTIDHEGQVSTEVTESVSSTNGKKNRKYPETDYLDEFEDIIDDINLTCFEPDIFHEKMTQKVIAYIEDQYQDELEFLWKRFPNNAIFRRKDNAKWYAALLTVDRKKLKMPGEGLLEIIDLKASPDTIDTLIDHDKYLPGYHMNKQNWFTIRLDGSVSFKEIRQRIDDSFALAGK